MHWILTLAYLLSLCFCLSVYLSVSLSLSVCLSVSFSLTLSLSLSQCFKALGTIALYYADIKNFNFKLEVALLAWYVTEL